MKYLKGDLGHTLGPGQMRILCAFESCWNEVDCRGYCSGHDSQRKRGKKLVPLRGMPGSPLTKPSILDQAWDTEAACKDPNVPLEWFFAEGQDRAARDMIAAAKAVCARCPVKEDCLAYATKARERGLWGATTEAKRQMMTQPARQARKGSHR